MCNSDTLLVIIAIIFPPLPVWIKRGLCSADSLINIALCCLGFLPGLIHSWYIIAASPEEVGYVAVPADYDVERHAGTGRVRLHARPLGHGTKLTLSKVIRHDCPSKCPTPVSASCSAGLFQRRAQPPAIQRGRSRRQQGPKVMNLLQLGILVRRERGTRGIFAQWERKS